MMPTKEEDGTHVCLLEERQPPEKLSMNKSHQAVNDDSADD